MDLPRLILVSGKGGTGKSSTAGALALALSRHSPTVLADLDQQQTAGRMLELSVGASGNSSPLHNLEVRSFSPRRELESFIERIVPIKMISRRMLRSHTFGYVTAALPGLEGFLMLEKLRMLADEAGARGGFAVIDAPASGSLLELLSVPQQVRSLAPSGTLNRLAEGVKEFVRNRRRLGVWLTARPERWAISEALETLASLRDDLQIGSIRVILNGVPSPLISSTEYLQIRQLPQHRRLALQRKSISEMAARAHQQFLDAGVQVIDLPMLYTPKFGRPQLQSLADVLERVARKDHREQ